jgi:hypothetical protein
MGSKKAKELASPQPPQGAAAGGAASTPQAKTPKGGKKRRAEEAGVTPSRGGAGGGGGADGAGGGSPGGEPPAAGPASAVDAFCARIGEHSAFFDHLVSLIPARFYLAPENEPETVRLRGSGGAALRWHAPRRNRKPVCARVCVCECVH